MAADSSKDILRELHAITLQLKELNKITRALTEAYKKANPAPKYLTIDGEGMTIAYDDKDDLLDHHPPIETVEKMW